MLRQSFPEVVHLLQLLEVMQHGVVVLKLVPLFTLPQGRSQRLSLAPAVTIDQSLALEHLQFGLGCQINLVGFVLMEERLVGLVAVEGEGLVVALRGAIAAHLININY